MSTMDDEVQRAPHKWVADKIGFSIAGVSLLRSGLRRPSVATMEAVERAFGWTMEEQIGSRHRYAADLERRLEVAYGQFLEQQEREDAALAEQPLDGPSNPVVD